MANVEAAVGMVEYVTTGADLPSARAVEVQVGLPFTPIFLASAASVEAVVGMMECVIRKDARRSVPAVVALVGFEDNYMAARHVRSAVCRN